MRSFNLYKQICGQCKREKLGIAGHIVAKYFSLFGKLKKYVVTVLLLTLTPLREMSSSFRMAWEQEMAFSPFASWLLSMNLQSTKRVCHQ